MLKKNTCHHCSLPKPPNKINISQKNFKTKVSSQVPSSSEPFRGPTSPKKIHDADQCISFSNIFFLMTTSNDSVQVHSWFHTASCCSWAASHCSTWSSHWDSSTARAPSPVGAGLYHSSKVKPLKKICVVSLFNFF